MMRNLWGLVAGAPLVDISSYSVDVHDFGLFYGDL